MTSAENHSPSQRYEHQQRRARAAWAVNEADSGGRRHEESDHAYRTCFQRDRDRIIHCSAFRRLDFKTQVFVPHEHDHYRTRLTHTLEVAQIGRDLARAMGLNEDLAEVVALAHDLGHPPFGHEGEAILDELMADHGGFEHNRQSLRVVDYLEHPYPNFRGLNLTYVARECLARHETRYDKPSVEEFPPGQFAPMEGQLVDLADEIAYTAADLDDALSSATVDVQQLAGVSLWQKALAGAEAEYPLARPIQRQIRATKGLLAAMADDVIATTRHNVTDVSVNCVDDVRSAERKIVTFSDQMRREVNEVQAFLLHNVYLAPRSEAPRHRARQVIGELFVAYTADPSLLPDRYRRRIGGEAGDSLHRVACDYIAGMTDRFCCQEHSKLTGQQ